MDGVNEAEDELSMLEMSRPAIQKSFCTLKFSEQIVN